MIEVELLESGAAGDAELVARLTRLVNEVYEVAEEGLWPPGNQRADAEEMAGLIRGGEIAVARVEGDLAGLVRIQDIDGTTGEFGMLVADPDRRGIGIGRELIVFAEAHCRDLGRQTMQLELLVPRDWTHPVKVFLDEWYSRLGYRVTRKTTLDEAYPNLAPNLATECDFLIYEKAL